MTVQETTEKQRLLDRLCGGQLKRLRRFHITRGYATCTEEELCAEIKRALDQHERGEAIVTRDFPDEVAQRIDVRGLCK